MSYNIQMNYFDGSSYQELNPRTISELINCHYMDTNLPLSTVLTNIESSFNSYAKQLVYKTTYIGNGNSGQSFYINTPITSSFFIVFGNYDYVDGACSLLFASKNSSYYVILLLSDNSTRSIVNSTRGDITFSKNQIHLSLNGNINNNGRTYDVILFPDAVSNS